CMIGVAKDVGGRLVDRLRPRPGRRIGLLAGMQAERVELEKLRVGHRAPLRKSGGPLNRIDPAAALFFVSASTLCNLPAKTLVCIEGFREAKILWAWFCFGVASGGGVQ